MNSFTGIATDDFLAGISANRIPIQVLALDTAQTVLATHNFTGCFPSNIGGFDYDVTSGDPLSATVTMQFASKKTT